MALLLVAVLLFALSACGEEANTTNTTTATDNTTTTAADSTTTAVDGITTSANDSTTTANGATTTVSYVKVTSTTKPSADKKPTSTTATTIPFESRFPEYYELSRRGTSSVTIESMFRKIYAYSEDIAGFSGDPDQGGCTAIYSADGSADQLQYMDIYGYNLTVDDLLGSGWGGVDFYSDLIGSDMKVDFKNANGFASLPLKNKADILVCMKRDVAKVETFLGGKGNPYAHVDYTSQVSGIGNITDAMIEQAANCERKTLQITATDLVVDGKTFNMSFTFSSHTDEEGKNCYSFFISIHTIR